MDRKMIVCLPRITEEEQEAVREAAQAHGFTVLFFPRNADALPYVSDAEIILGSGLDLCGEAKKLKWFCAHSAGVEHYTPEAFASPDAVLTCSSGAYGVTIAEHIVMVTLELMRRQLEYGEIVRERAWKRLPKVRSIFGSRVTMLGTGDIGQEAAKRLWAFQPETIVGVNRGGANPEELFDRVVTIEHLDEVLPETDLLIVSLPGTKEAEGVLSKERLSLLPSDSFLVNVGRGNAIDQEALESLLRQGHFAGAALDVFTKEPLPPDSSLWDCPRLLITPHTAGNLTLPYTVQKIVSLFLADFENYCAGRPFRKPIDMRRGY